MHVVYNKLNGKSASRSAVFQVVASYWEWCASALKVFRVRYPKEIFRLLSYNYWTSAAMVLRYLLKPKGGWAPESVPNFVTPGMDFASAPFLLKPNHPATLENITCTSLYHALASNCHKTWSNILLIKPSGYVPFPGKTSAWRRQQKGNS